MSKFESSKTKYCLQWETHPKHTFRNLCSLMEHQSLVDIAISCGNNTIHAHKCVLAAASPYFREELEKNSTIEQILIVGFDIMVMKSIVEFIYCGETTVIEEHLKYVIAAAKLFQLRGLERLFMDRPEFDSTAASSESDGGVNEDNIQSLLNDTGSELSSLSHLDAPSESLYMIGGVCVAMFLVGLIIILLAVTISKLRKREEHSNSVHPADVVLQTAPVTTAPTQTAPQALQPDPLAYRGQFLWQYPPPSQHMYNNDQDTLVQNLPTERPGLVRGFRKNLGGRWRRLVKRKPQTEVYTIPAELKPQLKQIYVY